MQNIFTAYIAVAYVVFSLVDFLNGPVLVSSCLKLSTVIAAFLVSVFRRNKLIISSALFVTCVCDALLLLSSQYSLALSLFCVAHGLYFCFLSRKKPYVLIPLFVALPFLAVSNVIFSAGLYAAFFTLAFCAAMANIKDEKAFAAGYVLFLICDVLTLLYNISGVKELSNYIWLFYCPSQLLIALCAIRTPLQNKQSTAYWGRRSKT